VAPVRARAAPGAGDRAGGGAEPRPAARRAQHRGGSSAVPHPARAAAAVDRRRRGRHHGAHDHRRRQRGVDRDAVRRERRAGGLGDRRVRPAAQLVERPAAGLLLDGGGRQGDAGQPDRRDRGRVPHARRRPQPAGDRERHRRQLAAHDGAHRAAGHRRRVESRRLLAGQHGLPAGAGRCRAAHRGDRAGPQRARAARRRTARGLGVARRAARAARLVRRRSGGPVVGGAARSAGRARRRARSDGGQRQHRGGARAAVPFADAHREWRDRQHRARGAVHRPGGRVHHRAEPRGCRCSTAAPTAPTSI